MNVNAIGKAPSLVSIQTINIKTLPIPISKTGLYIDLTPRPGVCGTNLHSYESDCRFMPVVLGRSSACNEYLHLRLTASGTFAPYLTIPDKNLIPILNSLSDEAGTVLEPIV